MFSLLLFVNSFIQERKVYLVEEKLKKRTIIYVQNDTDTPKSVFLKINPTGYRRSANRPIIKNIPPLSKKQMLVLIPLKDSTPNYTYDLIINDALENMDIKRSKLKQETLSPITDSIPKTKM